MNKLNQEMQSAPTDGVPISTTHLSKYWVLLKHGVLIADPEDHEVPIFSSKENLDLFLENQGVSNMGFEIKELTWEEFIALVQLTSPNSTIAVVDHRGEIGLYDIISIPTQPVVNC